MPMGAMGDQRLLLLPNQPSHIEPRTWDDDTGSPGRPCDDHVDDEHWKVRCWPSTSAYVGFSVSYSDEPVSCFNITTLQQLHVVGHAEIGVPYRLSNDQMTLPSDTCRCVMPRLGFGSCSTRRGQTEIAQPHGQRVQGSLADQFCGVLWVM